MRFDAGPHDRRRRRTAPPAVFLAALALAIGLTRVPDGWSAEARGRFAVLLRPGQIAVIELRGLARRAAVAVKSHFGSAARLAQIENERDRLLRENRRLAAALELAHATASPTPPCAIGGSLEPLLGSRSVKARVLGERARTFLERQRLVDVGSSDGVETGALAVTPAICLDLGRDGGAQTGQVVVAAQGVLGKIVEVGPYTAVVRTLIEPGYRDVVQVGRLGPQGILEGTGKPHALIRLVDATEPVAVGDPVYAVAARGVVSELPLYGRVARLERPVGAAHWTIWMEPAADPDRYAEVAVLRVEWNPLRAACRESQRE
jgi:cell shape-determining protein MreC